MGLEQEQHYIRMYNPAWMESVMQMYNAVSKCLKVTCCEVHECFFVH